MNKNKGFKLFIAIIIVTFVGGIMYFTNINNKVLISENDENSIVQINKYIATKEYVNLKYNFKFTYPENWNIEEKNLSDFFDGAIGKDLYTGSAVIITNPNLPKKMYDCCYTEEEIEKNGIKPKLVLMAVESVKDSVDLKNKYFGSKTMNIFNELVSKGYSPNNLERLLSFVPNVGEYSDPNKVGPENAVWKDGCNEVNLLTINGNYVIKYSGCTEGVVQNTGALFVRKDNLIFKLDDDASEYSNLGDFDKILESFEFK